MHLIGERTRALLYLGLAILAVSLCCLTAQAQRAAQGIRPVPPMREQPPPPVHNAEPAPSSSDQSTSTDDDDEGPNWVVISIVAFIGLFIAAVIVLAVREANKKKVVQAPREANVIGGYRLQNHIMTGQASQVWEVVELASFRHFAMKTLLPEKVRDPLHRRLLYHEAHVGRQLAHPNIIKIVKIIEDTKNPCFIMEFFPAGSVKLKIMHKQTDFLREHSQNILKQTATALAFMHAQGWVHRDVKPDNLMVNSAGECKLIDFALAQRMGAGGMGRLFRKPKAQGTRSYMSPEQIGAERLDGRADIYSFGVSAYEMVTGRPPFRAASSQELLQKHITEKPLSPQMYNRDVTDEFAELVLRLLAEKKEQRPKDFHEVLIALRAMKVFKNQAAQPTSQS